jgi:integrator complex subunit 10
MSGLTDQQYLIQRARELKIKDPYQSKAWMLTANSLFPDTFSIQFESYANEKEARHFKECAAYFQKLMRKFPNEENFWKEMTQLTDALKTEFKLVGAPGQAQVTTPNAPKPGGGLGGGNKEPDDFYLQLYDNLEEETQQKVLILASERSHDTMQKCQLLLILIKKFPALSLKYGQNLVEALVAADSGEHMGQPKPLNSYRRMLVADVLPVVLGPDSVPLSTSLLHQLLNICLEFTVALVNRNNPTIWEVKDPWNLMFTNLEMIGRSLRWPICKNISKSRPEQIIVNLSDIQRSALQSSQDSSQFLQFFYCALVTCFQAIYQYDSLISGKDDRFILVEAFVTHDSENKTKRRKTTEETSSPLISHLDDLSTNAPLEDKLIAEFQNACGAWQLLNPSAPPQKFHSMLQTLGSVCGRLDPITKFNIDYLLQAAQFRECLQEVRQFVYTSSSGEEFDRAWAQIKLCIAHYCMGDYRSAAQSAVDALGLYDQLPQGKRCEGESCQLTKPSLRTRHIRFMRYNQRCVLGYSCKLLTSVLQERVGGGDIALGNMLILCQCDWPSLREQVFLTLHRIKMKQGLNYPLFTQYVINMDIIEELTYLATPSGGAISLDIVPGAGRTTSRPGTRGANRGEKEDFKVAMMKQAARSHEDINKLLVDFLTKNTEYILQCLT